MQTIKTSAIVIGIEDYRDYDKLATLYTAELGKIRADFKGVKKKGAKLKPYAQTFCFGDFELIKSGSFYTVTGVNMIESFYELTMDFEKFSNACKLLTVCNKATLYEQKNPQLLVLMLNFLKLFMFSSADSKIVFIKFLLELYRLTGHTQNFTNVCSDCKNKILTHAYFDFLRGGVLCPACQFHAQRLTYFQRTTLRIITDTEVERLSSISFEGDLDEITQILLKQLELF